MQNIPKVSAFVKGSTQSLAGKVLLGAAAVSGLCSVISFVQSYRA